MNKTQMKRGYRNKEDNCKTWTKIKDKKALVFTEIKVTQYMYFNQRYCYILDNTALQYHEIRRNINVFSSNFIS